MYSVELHGVTLTACTSEEALGDLSYVILY